MIEDPKAGINTYKKYLAVRNHFKNEGYDYFKYAGSINVKDSTYLKRKDKIFFQKVEKQHKGEIVDFLVANFVAGNEYIRDMKDSALHEWRKITEALEYHVVEDTRKIVDRIEEESIDVDDAFAGGLGHPLVVRMHLGGEINIYTLCVLDVLTGLLNQFRDDPVMSHTVLFIRKLRPFLSFDRKEMARKLREVFEDVSF